MHLDLDVDEETTTHKSRQSKKINYFFSIIKIHFTFPFTRVRKAQYFCWSWECFIYKRRINLWYYCYYYILFYFVKNRFQENWIFLKFVIFILVVLFNQSKKILFFWLLFETKQNKQKWRLNNYPCVWFFSIQHDINLISLILKYTYSFFNL